MPASTMDLLPLDPPPAAPSFDYTALPADLANRQQERAARISGILRRTVEAAGEIGQELLAAQEELEHGQFLLWVERGVGLSKSSAYRFMDIARAFGSKLPTLGTLPLTVVQKLSEKSTPAPVRAAVLRRIEAGEVVQPDKILDEVREAKDEARKQIAAEKEKARRAALTPEQRDNEDAFRARGQKREEALARKQERDRLKNLEERDANEAEARLGAAYLLNQLGADGVTTFFARFDSAARYRIFALVQQQAHAERARGIEPVDVPLHQFAMSNGFEWLSPEDQDRARDLAQQIEADRSVEPVTVVDVGNGRAPRYEIVEGLDRYNALRGVLDRKTIPARIAPPVDPAAIAAFGGNDGRT
ncbi:DUF3102 domain-containing protein [Methylobacterium sp. J-088]|uniref:DUF3102 domain-containing protein n=1 Tax=Methylobacterium sp. J-088 TaxID=2836664 RepID=UPI001FB8A363|nr:DUF3102 domain-containing protein [Methylobacterium sp. J-088]MCJ2064358.1 DUF3102 domain-containing protein [Methylobacterium sp. J-088]